MSRFVLCVLRLILQCLRRCNMLSPRKVSAFFLDSRSLREDCKFGLYKVCGYQENAQVCRNRVDGYRSVFFVVEIHLASVEGVKGAKALEGQFSRFHLVCRKERSKPKTMDGGKLPLWYRFFVTKKTKKLEDYLFGTCTFPVLQGS